MTNSNIKTNVRYFFGKNKHAKAKIVFKRMPTYDSQEQLFLLARPYLLLEFQVHDGFRRLT